MTERYAHLAPENLVDAVSSIETRLHYGSTLDDNNKVTGEEMTNKHRVFTHGKPINILGYFRRVTYDTI